MEDGPIYIPRIAEKLLEEGVDEFPVCLITGPRQAGKSTLLREFLKGWSYANLDDLDTRGLALNDPKLFFQNYPPPVIIDEIQYAPGLLSTIKVMVDEKRHKMGQFVLTGSQTFQVMKGVSESLAGRIDIFELYPLTWQELKDSGQLAKPITDYHQMLDVELKGFYPELYSLPKSNPSRWLRTYIKTYLERDVRDIKAVADLSRFQMFIKLLATRGGQLLNILEVAKETGISHSTAKDWLSILESTYIVRLLKPYHNNATKRLIKSPKLYFYDTGLFCYLLGIESTDQLNKSPFHGAVFENMIVMEFIKKLEYKLSAQKCYFYKAKSDTEVDLIIAGAEVTHAMEIKLGANPSPRMADSLKSFKKEHPQIQTTLITLAEDFPCLPHTPDIKVLHWSDAIDLI